MPSALHEALVTLFRDRPSLAPALAASQARGLVVPDDDAHVQIAAAEFAELEPAEYRADMVLLLADADGQTRDALVVEIQLDIDRDKRFSWPLYLAGARARFRCPATLVVVTLDESVARWCRRPIQLDRADYSLTPVVVGPEAIPTVTSAEDARADPELAVLSVIAHGREPGSESIALAALAGCATLDNQRAPLYADLVLAHLGQKARTILEVLMAQHNYTYQSDFARHYVEEGKRAGIEEGKRAGIEEGLRAALRAQLGERFGTIPAELESRLEQGGAEDLSRWLRRILTASSPEELFADD